jgi:large subunit ribosomal protein L24
MIYKWKIKRGDEVIAISGRSKGKKGKVIDINKSKESVVVEGINMVHHHKKINAKSPGGIIEREGPMHVSNVSLLDKTTGNPTRVGFVAKTEDLKRTRYLKSSGEKLDN